MAVLDSTVTGNYLMPCMEIWSGNHATASSVVTPGLDICVISQPHQSAQRGGDVFYVSLCGGGITTRVILADLSGHGESASWAALALRELMRKNINTKKHDRMMRDLNREFLSQSQNRNFATAIVATYLANSDTLSISNAGHPRPFLQRAYTGKWQLIKDEIAKPTGFSDLPLGIDEETEYGVQEIPLSRGDMIVFYSDALVEAESPQGKAIGEARLLALFNELGNCPPTELGSAVINRLHEYRGGAPAGDDETLMIIRHNAEAPRRPTVGEKMDVYAKVLGLRRV